MRKTVLELAVLLAVSGFASLASAQHAAQSKGSAKQLRPSDTSCDVSRLSEQSQIEGSAGYKALRHELLAISVAQEGLDQFETVSKEKAFDAASIAANLFRGYTILEDHFNCAAAVVNRWNPKTDHMKALQRSLVHGYMSIAAELEPQREQTRHTFRRLTKPGSSDEVLKDAELKAASDDRVDKAQSFLVNATGYSLLLAVDGSDPNAETTPYLNLTCYERQDILLRSSSQMKDDGTIYQKMAGLIHKGMTARECHKED